MFEAYRVGITISLTNQVSSVLGLIARDFAKTNLEAAALKTTLSEIKLLGATGLVLGGLGYAGVRVIADMVKPATEYAHQLNIMDMAGLSQVEIAQAVGDAWKNTGDVITTTATGNLRMLLDLRNVLGDMEMARGALQPLSMMQAVMASSSEADVRKVASDNFAFSIAKAIDIIGGAKDPGTFERMAGEMGRVITAYQGRITPQMFQSVFAYSRQEKFGMSEEFWSQILPTLMLEYSQGTNSQGGGSRGVGPALAAFNRMVVQGNLSRQQLGEWGQLGLVNPASALQTTTTGTIARVKGAEEGSANPFLWVQDVLLPAIRQKFGADVSPEQIRSEVTQLTKGNQLAAQIILEFALKQQNFLRDQRNIISAMDYKTAFQQALFNDPDMAYAALGAQWDNLKTVLGKSVIPILIPALQSLSSTLNTFSQWAEKNPTGVTVLVDAFVALSGALAFSGVVLTLTAAFKALSLVLTIGGFGTALDSAASGARALMTALGPLIAIAGAAWWLKDKAEEASKPGGYNAGKPWWDTLPGGIGKVIDFLGSSPPPSAGISSVTVPVHWDTPTAPGRPTPIAPAGTPQGREIPSDPQSTIDALRSALHGMAVYLNGEQVGNLVAKGQAAELRRPPDDSGLFDYRLSPSFPGSP